MPDSFREFQLADATATEALGAALADAYVGTGRGSAVIHLRGELGAGKTTCVRSFLRTLGVEGPIRSPTYTLVEVYPLAAVTCVHVDLYRLDGRVEVDELGLRDYFDGACLLLAEWPEKGAGALPPADIELALRDDGGSRRCALRGTTPRGEAIVAQLPPQPGKQPI